MPPRYVKPTRVLANTNSLEGWKNPADNRILYKLPEPITIELMDKMELGNDSFIYRFALPGRESVLGHHTCQYLQLEADVPVGGGKTEPMQRYYHPMSKVTDTGIVDLLIRVYLRNMQNP